MKHSRESYAALGYKAGQAMRRKDISLFNHHNGYFLRWLAVESSEEKQIARDAYNQGYRGEILTPTPAEMR